MSDTPTKRRLQPSRGVRQALLALVAAPFSLIVVVLLLADRAPGITIAWLRRGWMLGSSLQHRLGIDVVDHDDLPVSFDTAGHLTIWFVAGVLAHVLLGGSVRLRTLFLGLLVTSASFEVAQGFLTIGRKVQLSDGIANGVGALLGLLVSAALMTIIATARQVRLAAA